MIPNLSVAWIIAFVLVLSVVLDRLLLRPLTQIMQERQGAIRSARELAQESRVRAQAAADELSARTTNARAEVYRQMDDARRAALARRASLMAETRREIEQTVADASARLESQTTAARAQLDRDADAMASTIVERVLGRKAS